MIPEKFIIRREKHEGGVLAGIYHHSMSLKGAVESGAMPPLEVFNDFMSCGYDDMEQDLGCLDFPRGFFGGAILEWEPFTLTQAEYDEFLQYLASLGKSFEMRDLGVSTYQEWFTKLPP